MSFHPYQQAGSVVAYILVQVHDHGGISIEGNVGDKDFALKVMDHAKDAIRGTKYGDVTQHEIPAYDVEATPTLPLAPMGDLRA
jgi:hypothetical protein